MMSVVSGLAIYFVIWWITLFMVLPFGVRRDEQIEIGNDPGAPIKHHILLKMFINSILAFFIWLLIFLVDFFDVITFRDFV